MVLICSPNERRVLVWQELQRLAAAREDVRRSACSDSSWCDFSSCILSFQIRGHLAALFSW